MLIGDMDAVVWIEGKNKGELESLLALGKPPAGEDIRVIFGLKVSNI